MASDSLSLNTRPVMQQNEPEKKGWLYKWTNYLKGYQKRYFVLTNGNLYYYRNPLEISQSCRGAIRLESAVIHSDDSFNFSIMGPMATYHLKAASDIERQQWVEALELAKVRAIRQSDADDDDIYDLTQDKKEMLTILDQLQTKLDQLTSYSDVVNKHANQLQRSLSELEATKNPEEAVVKISTVNERATVFRITSLAMINASIDYLNHCKNHCKKLQKVMEHEHESRLKLEDLVEQLATQHSHLEQRAIKQQQSGGEIIEDDEFYDAEDVPMANEYVITFPGKAHRVSSAISLDQGSERNIDAVDKPPSKAENVTKKRHCQRKKAHSLADSSNSNDEDDDDYSSEENIRCQVDVVTRKSSVTAKVDNMSEDSECKKDVSNGNNSLVAVDSVSSNAISKRSGQKRRMSIPQRPNHSLNLWSIMKNCIGKELTKIPMPVNFNEPLSMLQRMTEEFEYASLLHKAAKCTDPFEQMVYVAAFSSSCYATTSNRTNKPFNPLLGETYECDRTDDLGWRCISEQVSHHPPMLAQHCEADDWICWREFAMTSKFRGKYLSVTPIDITHLEFKNSQNHYTWRKVTTTVHNIIVGKLWVDNHGEMKIVNHNTCDTCHLNFHPYSYFGREAPRKISGVIVNKEGDIKWVIQGTWDNKLEAAKVVSSKTTKNSSKPSVETGTPKVIWKRVLPPAEFEKMYNMTVLSVQLNEPEEGVAPTDSRLRSDQRLMEEAHWDEANEMKARLEDKQRIVRRQREEEAEIASAEGKPYVSYEPIWFKKSTDPITSNPVHIFTGDYWSCKERQDWKRCPRIYLEEDV